MNKQDINTINCNNCKYYYVTWDKKFPYGCRAMNFKSKNMPYIDVLKNSGKYCLNFKNKKI